jgi:hypothetical protein
MKTKELYDRACVQIDAQAEHIGELMKENATLKAEVKRNCKDRKKYLDERNKLKEQVKILSSKELMGKVLLEQEDALRDLETENTEKDSIICNLRSDIKELEAENKTLKADLRVVIGQRDRKARDYARKQLTDLRAENAKLKADLKYSEHSDSVHDKDRKEAWVEIDKLRKSRDRLAENLAKRTLWTGKDRNKDKVKQNWIEWSEKE